MWKRRLIEVFAIVTVGDGLIEFLAPEKHSRLWVVGPKRTRRVGMWFVEEPDRMRVLGAAQVVLGVWLALSGRQLKFVDTSRPLYTERRWLGRRRVVSRYINELANGTT